MPYTYTLPTSWTRQLDGTAEPATDVKTWLDARPFLGPLAQVGPEKYTTWHDALDFEPGLRWCREFTFDSKEPS